MAEAIDSSSLVPRHTAAFSVICAKGIAFLRPSSSLLLSGIDVHAFGLSRRLQDRQEFVAIVFRWKRDFERGHGFGTLGLLRSASESYCDKRES
jgi:hypothetical protein